MSVRARVGAFSVRVRLRAIVYVSLRVGAFVPACLMRIGLRI